ncbi:outer envelope protein 61 isoform X1 [Triticum aestivum]|uniref:outer envelope protein 61 isoform X1 n=1 Tax=Triticum aestivum TaxID=4565 RepID=UPI001D01E3C5|nr:outer envelope protein 61-like isoform X1 [Triticum aestivum]
MMDPEMMRLAQEQMRRMSPDDLARMQQQLMSNPDLIKLASESMKNMRTEDFKRAAQQLNQTRPEEMLDMTEKIANAKPEEFAAMKAQADAQISYALSGAKMLKQQGNELHSHGKYTDAAAKYKLAKENMKSVPSAAGRTLQLQCTLNLMSCYLKSGMFEECVNEGSEVLTYDSSNVKAYYRRGQAYKELGNLQAAVADLRKAHEISPEDETIAEVLRVHSLFRDTDAKLATEGGGTNLPKGVVIEEIVEEDSSELLSTQRSSSTEYTVSQPHEGAGNSRQSDSSESLMNDPATIRSFQNYVSNSDADGLSKLGMQGMSPELVKTASEMIGTMKPEELQKMFQAASSLTGTNPVGSNLGPNMPEMSPDMVSMASEMIGKMSPSELQNMMDFASKMGGPGSAPVRPGTGSNIRPSSRAETSSNNFQPSSSQTVAENPDEIVNNQSMDHSSSSSPVSTADMQETMRNSMKDPAMRQMFASMMKNMSPDVMANMSEQFGMKLSKEDAAKAQQAMSSLSPEDLDRMMKWMDRAQQGVEVAKKTKNWLLGRKGLILAIVMLILAFILQRLGFIGR